MTGRDRAGEILTELSTIGVHLCEPVGLGFDEANAFSGRFYRNSSTHSKYSLAFYIHSLLLFISIATHNCWGAIAKTNTIYLLLTPKAESLGFSDLTFLAMTYGFHGILIPTLFSLCHHFNIDIFAPWKENNNSRQSQGWQCHVYTTSL